MAALSRHSQWATRVTRSGDIPVAVLCVLIVAFCFPLHAGEKTGVGLNKISLPSGPGSIEGLGDAFDDVILYQDACQRGREDGEVIALLREGLANARRTRQIDAITGEFLAIDTALARLQAGDLCLILIDQVEEALAHIARRVAKG